MALTVMIIPDLQVPLHDKMYVERLVRVAKDIRPDKLGFIGDLSDSTEISRWVKGKPGEYTGQFQNACDQVSEVVRSFRAVAPKADMWLQNSNHDGRILDYLAEGAPALVGQRSLQIEEIFGLNQYGVAFKRKPYEFLPAILSVHGHEESYSSVPGKYGLDAINRYGMSVVYGHTHRPLLVTNSRGYDGRVETQFAMNVGHGMDTTQVDYLKAGHMNWCRAFGVITLDNGQLYPELVISLDGTFRYHGKLYA
jgi:hypothetical protein